MFPTIALQPGSSNGDQVKQLQNWLVSQGYLSPAAMATGPGIYGPATTEAVRKWQVANGVDNSSGPGYWGPKSIAKAQGTSGGGTSSGGGAAPLTQDQINAISQSNQNFYQTNPAPVNYQPYQPPGGGGSVAPTGAPPPPASAEQTQYWSAQAQAGQKQTLRLVNLPDGNYALLFPDGSIKETIPPGNLQGTIDFYTKGGMTQYWNIDQSQVNLNTPQQQPQPQPEPTPTPGMNPDGTPIPPGGTPYFMGEQSLIRFSGLGPTGYMNSNIVWLLDPATKTLRPFANEGALQNFFDSPVNLQDIQMVDASQLSPGGLLGSQNGNPGFEVLSSDYAVKPDGTAKRLDYSGSQLMSRYGNGVNEQAEQQGFMTLDGFVKMLSGTDSGISPEQLNKLKNDDTLRSYYLNAVTYGGYSLSDVYRDLKARQLGLTDIKPISATAGRDEWMKTPDGSRAASNTQTMPPPQLGGLMTQDLNLSIFKLPDEVFKTLVPILDYNSAEFKQKMNEVQSAYHDILLQQVNATTEQEKAVADHNWETFRTELSKNYGIQLSNNSLEAWNQIENALNEFSNRNLTNTGLQNEAIDDYLKRVRRADQISRDEKLTKEEEAKMKHFTTFASSQEIKDLAASDPELAKKWGLVPSDEMKGQLTLAALKAKYPNEKDETLQRYISSILDENGNYRSTLFAKQMGSMLDANPTNPNLATIGGVEAAKRAFQQQTTLEQSLRDEQKAYKEFTMPVDEQGNPLPFLRDVSAANPNVAPYVPPPPSSTVNLHDQIQNAQRSAPSAPAGNVAGSSATTPPAAPVTPPVNTPAPTYPSSTPTYPPANQGYSTIPGPYDPVTGKLKTGYTAPPVSTLGNYAQTPAAPLNYTPANFTPSGAGLASQTKLPTTTPNYNMSTNAGPVYAPSKITPKPAVAPMSFATPQTSSSMPFIAPSSSTSATGGVSSLKTLASNAWGGLKSFLGY